VVGTATSLTIRRTPAAHPGMPFQPSSLVIHRETWQMLRRDGPLMKVLLISSLFWFLGGAVQPSVNSFGKTQMLLGDARTSLMAACLGVGIAIGCIVAGLISRARVSFRVTRVGAWGVVLSLAATAWLGAGIHPASTGTTPPAPPETLLAAEGPSAAVEPFTQLLVPRSIEEGIARCLMTVVGLSAGLFIVPLQVFMQLRPPQDQKGRMIGAMNLINWIGIVLSAAFYFAALELFAALNRTGLRIEVSWIFAALAALLLPVALFYHPRDEWLA
jgi:acyl-[acyl-carrier-protein]-phospholipid O-acyltransferase/long-chain-fatty-acid--[acyl-carrier-protein] ligase